MPIVINERESQLQERIGERQRRVAALGQEAVRLALERQSQEDGSQAREQDSISSERGERERPLRPANSHEQIMNDPALRKLYEAQGRAGEFKDDTEHHDAIESQKYSEKVVQDLQDNDPALHTLLSAMYGGNSRDIVENLAIDTEGRLLVAAYLSDKFRFLADNKNIPEQIIHTSVQGSLAVLSGGLKPQDNATLYAS